MTSSSALLVRLGGRQYGLPLSAVERVFPMAEVLSLPSVDAGLHGMLNLHGEVLPVVDPRPRLGLTSAGVAIEHRLVLLRGNSLYLLWVDDVDDVVSINPDQLSAVPSSEPLVANILRMSDGIIPVLAPGTLEPSGAH